MTKFRFQELAEYNARCAKGVVHTDEYIAKMAAEQREFDREFAPRLRFTCELSRSDALEFAANWPQTLLPSTAYDRAAALIAAVIRAADRTAS